MNFTCKRCGLEISTTDKISYSKGLCIDCEMGKPILSRSTHTGCDCSKQLHCNKCGKPISTPVPDETIIRAWCECPECIEKEGDKLARIREEVEKMMKKIDIELPDTLHRNIGYNQAIDDVLAIIDREEKKW